MRKHQKLFEASHLVTDLAFAHQSGDAQIETPVSQAMICKDQEGTMTDEEQLVV